MDVSCVKIDAAKATLYSGENKFPQLLSIFIAGLGWNSVSQICTKVSPYSPYLSPGLDDEWLSFAKIGTVYNKPYGHERIPPGPVYSFINPQFGTGYLHRNLFKRKNRHSDKLCLTCRSTNKTYFILSTPFRPIWTIIGKPHKQKTLIV